MKTAAVLALAASLLSPLPSAAQTGMTTTQILQTDTTTAGLPFAYPRTDHPEVTALLVQIEPGGETGWHVHPNPTFAYVLEGTLEVEVEGGSVHTFQPGEGFVEVADTRHNGRNRGDAPVKILVVFAGARDQPNVVRPD